MKLLVLFLFPLLVQPLDNLRGISVYGLETDRRDFVCTWQSPIDSYINSIAKLGFNIIRLPFSYQYTQEGDFSKMDHIVNLCASNQLNVMLDMHRVWSWVQGPSPIDGISIDQFTNAWIAVLARYKDNPYVIGHNIYNEYQGTEPDVVQAYSRKVVNTVEKTFPGRYTYFITGTHWAGSLIGMSMEDLPVSNRIYYSVHKYHFSGDGSQRDWEQSFASLPWLPAHKIVIGEFGWDAKDPAQEEWATRFLTFLQQKNITMTSYWTVAHSHDTGNLYQDDCTTINWRHYNLLKRYWDKKMLTPRLLRTQDHAQVQPLPPPIYSGG